MAFGLCWPALMRSIVPPVAFVWATSDVLGHGHHLSTLFLHIGKGTLHLGCFHAGSVVFSLERMSAEVLLYARPRFFLDCKSAGLSPQPQAHPEDGSVRHGLTAAAKSDKKVDTSEGEVGRPGMWLNIPPSTAETTT